MSTLKVSTQLHALAGAQRRLLREDPRDNALKYAGPHPGRPGHAAKMRERVSCELGRGVEDLGQMSMPGKGKGGRRLAFTPNVLADPEVLLQLQDVVMEPPSARLKVTAASLQRGTVEVTCGPARLTCDRNGFVVLLHAKSPFSASSFRVVARAQLALPKHVAPGSFTWSVANEKLHLKWADGAVTAKVTPAATESRDTKSWAQGLFDGFHLEYSVMHEPHTATMAELLVDMNTSGWWFGGSHLMRQHWPLNTGSWEVGPHYPFDNGPHGLNTLVSSHWMTSNGLLVMLDPNTPYLHVGLNSPAQGPDEGYLQRSWGVGIQNMSREYLPADAMKRARCDGLLRLQARTEYNDLDISHPMVNWETTIDLDTEPPEPESAPGQPMTLRVALCAQSNIRAAAQMALAAMPQPKGLVAEDFIRAPIWTTWARYGAKVSEKKVRQFADEIVQRSMARSVMEIDDKWQSKYGDLSFDPKKFPDPNSMVEYLHNAGFKVTLWVMPFFERSSEMFKEGAPKGYFCSSLDSNEPGFFPWWNSPEACALDVTNPEATEWFVSKLKLLQQKHGIDGYKFDAGEPCFLPRRFQTHTPISNPSEYTRLYVQNVASKFALCEVRTGHQNQDLSLFTRMGDRFSTWGLSNGLRSLIPTLLTSGLAGYPFCLPDMIGGNAYFGQKPDMELMVRWAQVNALMPAMQFSIAPWDLSKEADVLCQQVLSMRNELVGDLLTLAKEAGDALAPICRPMWWLDPEDEETYLIKDQFVMGDDVIVAPVVHRGHTSRDVYLTAGLWADMLNPKTTYNGGQWIQKFDAPLHKLPCFIKVNTTVTISNITPFSSSRRAS